MFIPLEKEKKEGEEKDDYIYEVKNIIITKKYSIEINLETKKFSI